MPTTTFETIREEVMRPFGIVTFATTTNITTNNSVISTELSAKYDQNDYFNGWWFILLADSDGGTPANGLTLVRRVTDYVASTGTLTVAGAALAAEDEAVDCLLMRHFEPLAVRRAFNRARQDVFPLIGIVRDHQALITGPRQTVFTVPSTMRRILRVEVGRRILATETPYNIIQDDPGLEDWTTTTNPTYWDMTGETNSSMAQETKSSGRDNYAVLEGQSSARITAIAEALYFKTDDITPSEAIEGVEANLLIWAYTLQAAGVTPRITADSSGNSTGTAHAGGGWERLRVSHNTNRSDTVISAGVNIANTVTGVVYVDEAILTLGPSEGLEGPWEPVVNWEHVPAVGGASNQGTIRLKAPLPAKQILRIVGVDNLSSVTADADTIEIDGNLLEPLYAKVREYLCQERARQAGATAEWKERMEDYRAEYEFHIGQGKRLWLPAPRTKIPDAM